MKEKKKRMGQSKEKGTFQTKVLTQAELELKESPQLWSNVAW